MDFADEGREDAPIVLLLHGLEGSSLKPYALLAYQALRRLGLAAVGMNFRSCGGEPNRIARSYHSGETEDPQWVLEQLHARWPGRRLGALAFSLGGNVLMKLLGDSAEEGSGLVEVAAVVSVPFDLGKCADALEQGPMARAYARHFLRSLVEKAHAKENLIAPLVSLDAVRRARTLREFDERATAPIHGFTGAAHYYASCSSGPTLASVRVPTLVIQSRDDPFLPHEALPESTFASNSALIPLISDHGGHVGFVEGPPWAPRFWAEREAARFLAATLLTPPSPSVSSPQGS